MIRATVLLFVVVSALLAGCRSLHLFTT